MHSYIFFHIIFNMAKDPVCNMNVEEKTANIHRILMEKKFTFVLILASNNLNKILPNMDIKSDAIIQVYISW
jgi:hypothetical protein